MTRNTDSDNDQPPAEAEHFVVCAKLLQTGQPEAFADDDCPPTGSRGEDVTFRSGDPIPEALAEAIWEDHPFPWPPKSIIALDAEGNVVGGAGGATSEEELDDEDAGALERFREYHWEEQR